MLSSPVTYPEMFGLIGKQRQIFNPVVLPVCVSVVYDFLREQVSADVLLHNVAMLKQKLLAVSCERWVRMVVRYVYNSVSRYDFQVILLPVWAKFALLAEHAVQFAEQTLTKHRVIFAAYIPTVCGICSGQVCSSTGATLGAIDPLPLLCFVRLELLAALGAVTGFGCVCRSALIAAKPVLIGHGRSNKKLFTTMLTDFSFAHVFYLLCNIIHCGRR